MITYIPQGHNSKQHFTVGGWRDNIMKLMVLAALVAACAGAARPGWYDYHDYSPPQHHPRPEYYHHQDSWPREEYQSGYPYHTEHEYYNYEDLRSWSAPQSNTGSSTPEPEINQNGVRNPNNNTNINSEFMTSTPAPPTPTFTLPPLRTLVVGGTLATIQEMPWYAGIYRKTNTMPVQICGGSLISNRAVISAAHCFWDFALEALQPASNYAVAVGTRFRPWTDTQDQPQRTDVSELHVPPRYYGRTTNHQDDLALLILTTPVQFNGFVRPVCLDFDHELETTQLQAGNLGMVGGWGLTGADGPPSVALMAAKLPYVSVKTCFEGSPVGYRPSITSDKICAGYNNGTAVCRGDSGAGLVFPSGGRNYLRGVVSTSPTDGERQCNVYAWGGFTLISKHEWFIKDNLKEALPNNCT